MSVRVKGKGMLYIGENPELVPIGEATYEMNFEPVRESGREVHFRNKTDAEEFQAARAMCVNWCKCELYLCGMREGHGGPFHAFPEHRCDEGLKNVRATLDDAAERDSPTFAEEVLGKWDNEALRKQLPDIFGTE
jgi:hypothetical protein